MDINLVLRVFPGTSKNDWHPHANGGGWVYKDAQVDESVEVGPTAIVGGHAVLQNFVKITDDARVYGNAELSGHVKVREQAIVAGSARLQNHVQVSGQARVGDNAVLQDYAAVTHLAYIGGRAKVQNRAVIRCRSLVEGHAIIQDDAVIDGCAIVAGHTVIAKGAEVDGHASIRGGLWTKSPLFITGSRWSVCTDTPSTLRIGCQSFTYPEWRKQQARLELEYFMTPEQCKEYRACLDLAESLYGSNAS